jgi:hypothetical protein
VELYEAAVRDHVEITPGSEEALALCVAGATGGGVGAARPGDRTARVSVTGAEQHGLSAGGQQPSLRTPGGGGVSGLFDGVFTPRGAGPERRLGDDAFAELTAAATGVAHLGRPDSPGAAEGRMKKYRCATRVHTYTFHMLILPFTTACTLTAAAAAACAAIRVFVA